MGTNRFFNPGTSLDVANGTVSDETDINDVVDDVTDSFNLVEDDITLLAAEVFTGGILDNTGLTTPITLGYTAAVPPATPAEYSVTLVNDAVANINTISTDGTLAGNTDTDIPTEKAVKTYADTKIASSYLDTDGTLTANSDVKVATQKATKTYADTKIPSSYLDTDGTLAANSDTKVASQKAVKTYVGNYISTSYTPTYRNIICNQEMLVNQKNENASVAVSTSARTVDRWWCSKLNTDQLVAGVARYGDRWAQAAFGYSRASLRCTVSTKETTTDVDEYLIPFEYKFTGTDYNHLRGTTNWTLSFDFKSNMPNNSVFSIVFFTGAIGVGDAYTYDFTYASTSTVQRITMPMPIFYGTSIAAGFRIAAFGGVNYQCTDLETWESSSSALCSPFATDWISYANGTYTSISSVQINEGTVETAFERKEFREYLDECYPYFYKTYEEPYALGTTDEFNAEVAFKNAPAGASIDLYQNVHFPKESDTGGAAPTVVLYSTSTGDSGKIRNVTAGTEIAATADVISRKGFNKVDTGVTTLADGDRIAFHYTVDSGY